MKNIENYLDIDSLLTEDQLIARRSTRDWVAKNISPVIESYNRDNRSLHEFIPEMGKMGFISSFIPREYGGIGADYVTYGLIMQELERGDSALRSSASVQTSLVMLPIWKFGSEQQKLKYLPKLASGEIIGCFGLTEPNHGSDPGAMQTRYEETDHDYIISGTKMWITNATVADLALVWAKGKNNEIKGFLIEKGTKGFSSAKIQNKWSLRASDTGELILDRVAIPKENVLPLVTGLKGPLACLNSARYGIAWGALGAAADCIQSALNYSSERMQFNKKINSFQLTQKKLAELSTEFLKAQLIAWRVGVLKEKNVATPEQISMIKRNNVAMALNTARETRQILGAMGITGEFPMMRHMMNLESVITYEGTHDIHLLITGKDITGESAFI